MRRISSDSDIVAALDALIGADPRLAAVRAAAGDIPLRLSSPGFSSLVSIVVSQQVSRASADAILGRLVSLVAPLTPEAVLAADPDLFRRAGLSRPKQATMLALSRAVHDGLDLFDLCEADGEAAIASLSAVPGIGRWTAEVYLLTCAGHPDVFPARDVALQSAVGAALGIDPRPGEKTLIAIAESWAPWRAVAARLFWAYYRHLRGREAAPAAETALNLEKN
ncbi:DNA-3-methyladenine glycosylase [Mesorhizobium sp. J428]|uniref:DNA-3-methyladenine glycosylase family protein n=1 Tax=Mesorhizobium sp. J428 TaxID=2898440 RepID=UPI0021510CB1|nr:DNA-3-methyladenine glycosylase [Mesorhizobium sp. J428]MCR5856493.1 DNA-3-methyladenine glycosylase [Mesorhizobium sp. J428]